jgi:hypothetical protein
MQKDNDEDQFSRGKPDSAAISAFAFLIVLTAGILCAILVQCVWGK